MSDDYLIGSIFEVATKRHCNYLQYAHLSEMGIPLLGVLQEEHSLPANSIADIQHISYKYFILYQIFEALKLGNVRLIGVAPVPEEYRAFPKLRSAGPVDASGKARFWFVYNVPITFNYRKLQDPKVRNRVEDLTEDQRELSTATILSHGTLLDRLESDWLPKDEI